MWIFSLFCLLPDTLFNNKELKKPCQTQNQIELWMSWKRRKKLALVMATSLIMRISFGFPFLGWQFANGNSFVICREEAGKCIILCLLFRPLFFGNPNIRNSFSQLGTHTPSVLQCMKLHVIYMFTVTYGNPVPVLFSSFPYCSEINEKNLLMY